MLEQNSVRATFFVIGKLVRAFPELAVEIVARGHTIANHTETHPRLISSGAASVREELLRCREAIAVGDLARHRWMRPPFGFRGPNLDSVVREMGFGGRGDVVALGLGLEAAARRTGDPRLRRVRGGDIVLLHDGDFAASMETASTR